MMKNILLISVLFISVITAAQTITVTSPCVGDTLIGANTYNITWTTTGTIDSVNIYYKKNGTLTLIQSNVANTGSFSWTVPSEMTSSNNGYIRIKNATSSLFDENDSAFIFQEAPKTITITYPNALTDTLQAGVPNNITWNTTGYLYKVKIYYSTNGGASYLRASSYYGTLNTGSFSWTPNNSISSSQLRIKIEGYGYYDYINDISDTNSVLLIGNTITIQSPESANFVTGTTRTLTWTTTGNVSFVDIEYSANWGAFVSIADSIANTGSYNWTIPSGNSSIRLRIKEHGNPSVDQTLYSYTISTTPETINLITPNGGQTFTEGDTTTISWTHSSNLNNAMFELFLSTDSGNVWELITDGSLSDSSFTWPIPSHISSSNCLIRISRNNPSIEEVSDTSNSTFTINLGPPSVVLTSMNGGGTYMANNNIWINYQTTGAIDSLSLYFTSDNGANWNLLETGINPFHTYSNIQFPDVHSQNCKIKLVANNNPLIKDSSDNTFTVKRLKLSHPYSNETYYSGGIQDIEWNYSPLTDSTVSLYYSIDNSIWTLICDTVPNNGSYSWKVPNDSSYNCKIKIIDNSNSLIGDSSSSMFKILPSPIRITFPNGGEYLEKQTYYFITWTTAPNAYINKIKLLYSTDGGSSWNYINSYTDNNDSYYWITPDIVSSNMLIKVENRYGKGSDISNATFNVGITPPNTITITSPNGGETLPYTGSYNIMWNSTGSVDSVSLYYSLNNGNSWSTIVIGDSNTNSYTWNYTALTSNQALIKVIEYGDSTVSDISNAIFNIGEYVQIDSPNGGEVLYGNTVDTIRWNASSSITNVKLDFYNGTTWTSITTSTPNTGKYAWTVPNISGINYKIRIRNDSIISDESDLPFTIIPYSSISLISPNGGETTIQGSSVTITWDTTGVSSSISLQLSSDSGITWQNIVTNYSNTGFYDWTVTTTTISSKCYIKISGIKNGRSSSDSSDACFNIIAPTGTLTLISPNGGEQWQRHSILHTIKWYKTGTVTAIDIFYSTNDGLTWDTIYTSITADSTKYWSIPFSTELSDSCLIKVQDHNAPYINDISSSFFSIIEATHSVYITSLLGPWQTWTEGETKAIEWTTQGIIPMVNIYVSSDNGYNYTLIEDSVPNNMSATNTYNWLVPHGVNAYACRIKVEELGNTTVYDADPVKITDIRTLTVISPNGGEVYNGMDSITILWAKTGLIMNIQVSLSVDSGVTWNSLIVVQDTSNIIRLQLPNITTSNALFKFSAGYNIATTILDISDSVFSINQVYRSITLLDPNGGGPYVFHWSNIVQWSTFGVSDFNAYYSPDNGNSWVTIPMNIATGSTQFYWQGPGRNIDSCLIKIEDADSTYIFDISDTAFAITGYSDLSVLTPNDGEILYNDSTYIIEWEHIIGTYNPTTHINLEYSLDSGNTWQSIINNINISTDSTYAWTIPSSISSAACLIRVVDYSRETNYDISDSYFTIESPKQISITSPIASNLLISDSSHTITWSNTGNINNVNIYYSLDSGLTWLTIDTSYNNTGSYSWNTPIGIHSFVFVKIADSQNDTIFDISDRFIMTTQNTTLTITQPNGGETLTGGQIYQVKWDWTGIFTTQWLLYYSLDSGSTWGFISDGNTGGSSYSSIDMTVDWLVPFMNNDTTFSNCLIKVISTASDTSDAVFTINQAVVNSYVKLTAPNGGDSLVAGGIKDITWLSNLDSLATDSLDIYFSADSGSTWTQIAAFEDNDSSFSWTVPQVNSSNCLIKIISSVDSTVFDISDSVFTILPSDYVLLTTPNGGYTYHYYGNPMKIYWTSYLVGLSNDSLDIYFSSDSAITWSNIASSVPNTGLYQWPIPIITSSTCLIRIQSSIDSTIFDISDSVFAIGAYNEINIVLPNGGEIFNPGTTTTIEWHASLYNLSNDSVDIYFSSDSAITWTNISINEDNDSNYQWTIPSIISTNCLIKIQSSADSSIFDISNQVFTINTFVPPSVTISSPSSGDTLVGGSNVIINWIASFGSKGIDSVNIYFTEDSLATWNTIALLEPNDSSYLWTIPMLNSSHCFIKIVSSNDSTISDTSQMFSITKPIGIQEFDKFKLNIYPNPTNSIINISSSVQIKRVELFDINGKLMLIERAFFDKSIAINTLPTGIYILRGYYDNKVFIRKIIKK